jgi:hypothetical protein
MPIRRYDRVYLQKVVRSVDLSEYQTTENERDRGWRERKLVPRKKAAGSFDLELYHSFQ